MRAAVLSERRKPLMIQDVEKPEIGENDVLVRVEAAGVCRTDWHEWNGDWEWVGFLFPLPVVPGHEFAGTVVELGASVSRVKAGDLVTAPFHVGCGTCASCSAGYSNRCLEPKFPGFTQSGAFGEYVAVANADFNCVVMPEGVDAISAATLGCRYMSAYRAVVARGEVSEGQWVAIHGAGGMGLAAVQIAKQRGARVVVIDNRESALDKAKAEGADIVLNSAKEEDIIAKIRESSEGGPHVAIDAIGGQETSVNGIASLRYGGRFVQAGLTTQDAKGNVTVPMDLIVALELEIVGSFGNPRSEYDELVALVANGELNPGSLVTRREHIGGINAVLGDMDEFNTVGVAVIDSFDSGGQ